MVRECGSPSARGSSTTAHPLAFRISLARLLVDCPIICDASCNSSAQNEFAARSTHSAALLPHTAPSHARSDGLLTRRVDLEPQILLVELSHEPAVWEGGAHASDAHEGAHEWVATREEARQLNTRVVHVARAEQKAARARLRWAAASGRARSETRLAPHMRWWASARSTTAAAQLRQHTTTTKFDQLSESVVRRRHISRTLAHL